MPLVPAKCPECGGNVVVDNEKEAWVCDFCKTPFVVDKAINNFNTINNITNNNEIKADVVNVYESKNNDFVIKAGVLEQYVGESIDIIIPDNVVKIANNAFRKCNEIRSIKINGGIKNIGSVTEKFFSNGICINEKIPDDVKIFSDCKMLEKVELSEGVEKIGDGIFSGCYSLRRINFPSTIKNIGREAFKETALEEVEINSLSISIGEKAFANCSHLQAVEVNCNKVVVGDFAFSGCQNLKNLSIPNATEIGNNFIVDCILLKQIELPHKIAGFDKHIITGLNTNVVNWIKTTGAETIGLNGDSKLVIPNGATKIEYNARTDRIKEIVVPGSVEYIHEGAFSKFINLESITFLNGLKSISTGAFWGCNKLKKLTIPSSVTQIGDCFRHIGNWGDMKGENTSLEEIEISEDVLRKHIGRFFEGIINTPYLINLNATSKFCPMCGTSYGIFTKKCSNCGHKKGGPIDIHAAKEYERKIRERRYL